MQTIDPKYIRISTVLYFFSGLQSVPKAALDTAAERGTRIHSACAAIIEGIGYPELDEKLCGYINSFMKWYEGKEFIKTPPRLYCDRYLITGEVDAIYKDESGLVLVDFKTPEKESPTWSSQGSAYEYLLKTNGYPISRIEFVKLSKSGNDPVVYTYEPNFSRFLCELDIYNLYFKNMKIDDLVKNFE